MEQAGDVRTIAASVPLLPPLPVVPGSNKRTRLFLGLAACAVLLAAATFASLALGSKPIALGTVLHALVHHDNSDDALIVRDLRLPRTVIGLAAGAALGLAGTLMQAVTRNPLADPGLLGVNMGASAAVVVGIAVLHLDPQTAQVWPALLGAGIAALLVHTLGGRGPRGTAPIRLALAGATVSAVLGALVSALTLSDRSAFQDFRFWSVGSLAGRSLSVLGQTGGFMLLGALIALPLAGSLNTLALGEDTGRALGVRPGRVGALALVSVTLLCGGAVAAAGPIGFVGLAVPHAARQITGPDHRWLLPYTMLLAPTLLLAADVVGRLIAPPGEVDVGIVTALVGAPVFIALARRRRVRQV
ncbi:FecCD family ABC transporter permease [Catenulispora pinisilvae]|uniref:FecCD family ABC transporter permease n=1 Tax=Catenulispora pinisilvae TaxID=2705253 RepID=UPI001891E6E6|nr:iron chelate uptake ABC transporter family permease subunit [Catenulispora pinisilvae]